jgi:hypothetical protein
VIHSHPSIGPSLASRRLLVWFFVPDPENAASPLSLDCDSQNKMLFSKYLRSIGIKMPSMEVARALHDWHFPDTRLYLLNEEIEMAQQFSQYLCAAFVAFCLGCGAANAAEETNGAAGATVNAASEPANKAIDERLSKVGTGAIPEGLLETDIKLVRQKRTQAAKQAVTALQARYEGGLDNLTQLLEAQIDLVHATLESEEDKEKRRSAIFEGLQSALLTWQRIKEMERAGARGGDAVSESRARSQVFKFRVMWLKEKT